MPVVLLVLAILAGLVFWILRAHGAAKQLQEVDRDTKGLQRRARSVLEDIVGTPLKRVRDPRLAATILMIQLVRTGSPVTAAEKTRILELMEQPLGVENVSGLFEKAWGYTQARRPFSLVADELLPLLRESLDEPERLQLVSILNTVAGAHSAPSELQREAVARLKRRLVGGTPALATRTKGGNGGG